MIAAYFDCNKQTVRETIHRWQKGGLVGLWEGQGRGQKRSWQEEDLEYLEQCLKKEQRTYNSKQLATKLAQDRKVKLSPDHLRRVLKKKGVIWKRTRQSHRQRQDETQRDIKQADLDMLELSAAAGEIDLFYLDESGFCMWSPVSYTYYFLGEQKKMEQTSRRGRRLSILGLWQPGIQFVYGLAIGSFNS